MNRKSVALLLILLGFLGFFFAWSCGDDDDDDDSDAPDDDDDDDDNDDNDDNDDDQPACDETLLPILYVHGMIDSGGVFSLPAMRFASNGYCKDRIFAFDWNTVSLNRDAELQKLVLFADQVLSQTGAAQLDLIGHSAGGSLTYDYLADSADSSGKVAHYVSLAASDQTGPPQGVPTLTISSPYDAIAGVTDMPGATNETLAEKDHVQVVTSAESFDLMYRFINDQPPQTLEIVPQPTIELSGRVVSLGENFPGAGFGVEVFAFDPTSGQRLSQTPVASLTANAQGYFGPVIGDNETYYEFVSTPTDQSEVPIHYYRSPQPRSNDLIYLRSFPGPGSTVGLLIASIPLGDNHTVLVSFTPNQAVVAGRDQLFVDGYEMSTEQMAAAQYSTIAIFFFDKNDNGVSDATKFGGIWGSFPFLQGFDHFIATEPARGISLELNGRTMVVPNLKSESEGVAIPMME